MGLYGRPGPWVILSPLISIWSGAKSECIDAYLCKQSAYGRQWKADDGRVDALNHLRKTFGTRALPPVRVNTRLAEAPSFKKTIFEHDPNSNGAKDYIRVVEWMRSTSKNSAMTRAA